MGSGLFRSTKVFVVAILNRFTDPSCKSFTTGWFRSQQIHLAAFNADPNRFMVRRRNYPTMAKTTKPEAPAVQSSPNLPIVQTLALMGRNKPIRVYTQGESVLGYSPCSELDPLETSLVVDVLAIAAMKMYSQRQGFGDVDVSKLSPASDLPQILHTMGMARLPAGTYSPISLKIQDGKLVASYLLFSSALGLYEALSVFKAKFSSFFIDRKVFIA